MSQIFTDPQEALAAAQAAGMNFGGIRTAGGDFTAFFLYPNDATDEQFEDLAFEAKYGRTRNDWDRTLKAYIDAFGKDPES
jgi:hypothetical protein